MGNRKRVLAAVLAAAAVFTLSFFIFDGKFTLALFSDNDKATNSIMTGYIEGSIDEKPTGMEKRNIYYKNAQNSISCYVRMLVTIPKVAEGSEVEITVKEGDRQKWYQKDDGYWYYKEALEPGANTSMLYESIRIQFPEGETIEPDQYNIMVYAEIVQSENIEIPKEYSQEAAYYVFTNAIKK